MVATTRQKIENDDEQEAWKLSIQRAKECLPEKASGPLVALLEGTSGHHHWTENSILPHQWMEGNLPMPSKCSVCEKPCGSVRKLVDYRCIWCGCCVHDTCIGNLARSCSLGHSALSVISPLALKEVNQMGQAVLREEAYGK
ncbi:hypothetical protein CAEBREN_16790 [Caenorhabditis brenneri]|uniref:diacylglycerol kinase (ATP) n=1 Tax=Caenorhabditis brenneri TaxID=135651 RepID=G0PE43_CAEBE|nr:hypothetical protein CAEBREN_16790 [Caenorhabditis brenneri]